MATKAKVTLRDLPVAVRQAAPAAGTRVRSFDENASPLDLHATEKRLIMQALATTKGNITARSEEAGHQPPHFAPQDQRNEGRRRERWRTTATGRKTGRYNHDDGGKENFRDRRRARRGQCRAGHGRDGAEARARGGPRLYAAQSAGTPAGARPKIVLGKEPGSPATCWRTRSSPESLRLGVDVLLIGPLPTPGVAYITRSLRADAGIVLSASQIPTRITGSNFSGTMATNWTIEIERTNRAARFHGRDRFHPADGREDRPRHPDR